MGLADPQVVYKKGGSMEPLEPWLNPPLILNTLKENVFVPVHKRKHETFNIKCGMLERFPEKIF